MMSGSTPGNRRRRPVGARRAWALEVELAGAGPRLVCALEAPSSAVRPVV